MLPWQVCRSVKTGLAPRDTDTDTDTKTNSDTHMLTCTCRQRHKHRHKHIHRPSGDVIGTRKPHQTGPASLTRRGPLSHCWASLSSLASHLVRQWFCDPPPPLCWARTKRRRTTRWRGRGQRAAGSVSRLGLLARCPSTWIRQHGGRHTQPHGRKREGHKQGYGALGCGIPHLWGKNRRGEPQVGQPANGW